MSKQESGAWGWKSQYALKEKYCCWFIKGNKETYWLKYNKAWKEKDSTTGALYYTYHNLTQQDFDFFGQLTEKAIFSLQMLPTITLCHGSPNKVNEDLKPNDESLTVEESHSL